jgi:hypothetical protein
MAAVLNHSLARDVVDPNDLMAFWP